MKRRTRRRVAFRGRRQNRFGMFLVSAVVVMLLLVISVNSYTLKQKQQEYMSTEAELDAKIADEESLEATIVAEVKEEPRLTTELAEFKKYTQTQAYIEEVAKDKLGLVKEGEIVFKMK